MRRGAGAIVRFACSFEAVLIIAIVALELLFCLVATVLIGVGNLSDSAIVPLQIWFVCAVLQLSIAWVPERRHVVWLVSLVMIGSFALAGYIPFYPQSLLVAAIAVTPQLWWQRFVKGRKDVLGIIALAALPIGVLVWSYANIGIVKFQAWRVSGGDPYCILV